MFVNNFINCSYLFGGIKLYLRIQIQKMLFSIYSFMFPIFFGSYENIWYLLKKKFKINSQNMIFNNKIIKCIFLKIKIILYFKKQKTIFNNNSRSKIFILHFIWKIVFNCVSFFTPQVLKFHHTLHLFWVREIRVKRKNKKS